MTMSEGVSKEAVELPEGVKRYVMYCSEPPKAAPAGDWIRVSDLPIIRTRWEQEVRERLGTPVTELIEYLVYSECARCELVNPERDACQCAVCDRLAELIGNLRSVSKALAIFGEAEPVEGENGG